MVSSTHSEKKILAIFLLIFTSVLWGSTFIITKTVTKEVPIFLYLSLRYIIALIGFAPIFIRLKKLNKKIVWMGMISGLIYYFAITFQTIGLQTTSAGKAGFITGLSTIMVPFLAWMLLKKKELNLRMWLAVILSIIGMAFLLLEGNEGVLIGDLLVLICAVFCALFIIFNDKYVQLVDVYLYSIMQLATLSILCLVSSLMLKETYDLANARIEFWLIIFYMGFIATTLTFLFQNWGQQYQGPSQTAIIFTLEPVFAVLFASYLIGNEILSLQAWIGCGLIFIAILITVIKNDQLNSKNVEKKNI
ncbi:MAG: DMT family transporter [Promethearchaeota archaeon]|nr:MAG: DMT family transporter [Candidatus Lokiarchaeota archaeon]